MSKSRIAPFALLLALPSAALAGVAGSDARDGSGYSDNPPRPVAVTPVFRKGPSTKPAIG